MKKSQQISLSILIIVFSLLISYFLPSIKLLINQTIHREFIERVNNQVLSANIMIIQLKYRNDGNNHSISSSPGSSGVIFQKQGNRYYALTAEHVVMQLEGVDHTEIFVLAHDDLDLAESINNGGQFQGVVEYYSQFPEAKVEYANSKYDLAVISFISDAEYTVLPVADEAPQYGETVASMGNPYRQRNLITAGKVNESLPKPFGDETGKMQYPIIIHTSYISEGSSGSALLNEHLEIVGINLGGNENIFRKFISGMAMPSDRVQDFLEEWEQSLDIQK